MPDGVGNDPARALLMEWDSAWEEAYAKVTDLPAAGPLPRRLVELIGVGIGAACTNLNAEATRRHIRGALDAGATREEILFVIKCASLMSVHSMSLGAPILLEEAQAAGVAFAPKEPRPTPACDTMRALGQWNTAWDPFLALDPAWTDAFMAAGAGIYSSGVMTAKETELLSIAVDAAVTHMYAPGTRRHIRNALKAGASIEEILCVLEICVAHGAQSCSLALPILAEELAKTS